jgi:putative phosphoribosyl transferase
MRRARWPNLRAAGRDLGEALLQYRDRDPVVVGLPRGGVVVADEVARALDAPLEVTVVRKVGAPAQPELGMGAVGPGGVRVLNHGLVRRLGVSPGELERLVEDELQEVERRMQAFTARRPTVPLGEQTVIVVDDGIATGGTAAAAAEVLRAADPATLVLAIPVCPRESVESLRESYDDVVVLATPRPFLAVPHRPVIVHAPATSVCA